MWNLPGLRGRINGRAGGEKEMSQVRYNRRAFQTISVGYQIILFYFFCLPSWEFVFRIGICFGISYHRRRIGEASTYGYGSPQKDIGQWFRIGWLYGHGIGLL